MNLLKKIIPFFLFALLSSCISNEISIKTQSVYISSVSPAWLSRTGGERVSIDGNFAKLKNLTITIDDRPCLDVIKVSQTRLTCLSPENTQIKNVQIKVRSHDNILAQASLKYVGVLGQRAPNHHLERQRGMNLPVMVKSLDSKLYIGDLGNRRIVGFNDFTSLQNRDFDFALGMTDVRDNLGIVPMNLGQYRARDLDYANGLFMFADGENNRVLIFDGYPKANQEAKIILGQPDAMSTDVNNGGISAKSLNKPMDAKFIDGKIFVSDALNNRILVWNSIPTTNFQEADFVLGQPDFNSVVPNYSGLNGSGFDMPLNIQKIENKLFVSDYNNARVLIWNSIPSSNVAADSVIGQLDLISKSLVASNQIIKGPGGFKYHDSTFYLADYGGSRVLVYKNFDPLVNIPNGRSADIVLGQPDFSTTALWKVGGKITSQSIHTPSSVEVHNNKLYVADTYNHRVLIFNHLPNDVVLDQHQAADEVIGQESFAGARENAITYNAYYTIRPSSVTVFDGKLLINSEVTNNVLVWNTLPTEDFAPADFVLGQNDFGEDHVFPNQGLANPTASTLNTVYQLLTHNNKLYASDIFNNRVLVWNSLNGTNGQAADYVFGQNGFNTNTSAPVSASSMNGPAGMDVVDNQLVVSDRSNHRLLIYNSVPTSSFVAANDVVGQNDFVSNGVNGTGNAGILAPNRFNSPFNSVSWLGQYVVADHGNRRILVWSSFESFIAKENPKNIWGQDSFLNFDQFSTLSINRGATFLTVRVIDDVLYVLDPFNNRILVFDTLPVGSIMVPSSVIGQPNFNVNNSQNSRTFAGDTFSLPVGIYGIDEYVYLADYLNNRVLILPR